MNTIAEHEFVENQRGELVLLINTISDTPPYEPVFLVSSSENTGFLRRDSQSDEFHEIVGINPSVIEKLRKTQSVLVVEMTDETIAHNYATVTGLYEEDA